MRLYIANVTKQNWIVFYRHDLRADGVFTAPMQRSIAAGRQEQVGGDLEQHQIDLIISQLEEFGMIAEMEVPNGLRGVHPLVWNLNRPVSERTMKIVIAHNMGEKMMEGEERRRLAAVAANDALASVALQSDLPAPPEFDVEIEQMEQSADEKRIEAGFHIRADAPEPKRGPGRPRKKV